MDNILKQIIEKRMRDRNIKQPSVLNDNLDIKIYSKEITNDADKQCLVCIKFSYNSKTDTYGSPIGTSYYRINSTFLIHLFEIRDAAINNLLT